MNSDQIVEALVQLIGRDNRSPLQNTGTRTTDQAAFGRTEKIVAGQPSVQMARVQATIDEFYSVSVDTFQQIHLTENLLGADTPDLSKVRFVWGLLKWGNGNVLFEHLVNLTFHVDIPSLGSSMSLDVYIGDGYGNPVVEVPVETNPVATVRVSISRGVPGLPQRNSFFIQQMSANTESQTVSGPSRLASVRGFATTGGPYTLMGFDHGAAADPVVDGTYPNIAIPIPAFPLGFDESWLNGFPLTSGLVWKISSTPDVLTNVPGAKVRIDTELFSL